MPEWKLIDPEGGVEVKPGDAIVSFRDEVWRFVQISKVPQQNGIDYSNGKILVAPIDSDPQYHTHDRELYPSVFDLKIVPA